MEEEVQWLSPREQQAWRTYLRGVAVVSEALNHDLVEELGISLNEYEVLSRLSETPGFTMRMSTLAEGLVAAADQPLYQAKNGGRNRVVCAGNASAAPAATALARAWRPLRAAVRRLKRT